MNRLLLTACALACLAGAAHAQDRAQRPNPDTDGDGKVTWSEYQAASAARTGRMFERLDADHDGKITTAETQGGGRMMRLDVDHDGAITRAELDAGAKARFDAADANHDGWLSADELAQMRQRRGGGQGRHAD